MPQRFKRRIKHGQESQSNARFVSVVLALALILGGVWVLRWASQDRSRQRADKTAAQQYVASISQMAPAPDFALQTVDGQMVKLGDYRGQVVLLNTWATWCPPCRAEMPDLEAYYREHKVDGFVVLAVNSGESTETVTAFLEEQDFTFPVLLDPDGRVMSEYKVRGLPTSFFIDRDGMMHNIWSGQLSPERLAELAGPLF